MSVHTHRTAPTRYVEANGTRFAYRRFGRNSGQTTGPESGKTVPLVFNMHLNGTMDHWDPAVTDGIAQDREVILFDNAGISSTSGDVPPSVEEMAANAAAFIKALGLAQVDVLGFSLGGLIGQELAIAEPRLVRRLVLVGTGARSAEVMEARRTEARRLY